MWLASLQHVTYSNKTFPQCPFSTSQPTLHTMSHSSYLPPELLQQIFRNLPFPSLLPYMRVNHEWNAALHGNDPVLYERLFQRSRYQPGTPHPPTPSLRLIALLLRRSRTTYVLKLHVSTYDFPDSHTLHPIFASPVEHMDIVNQHVVRSWAGLYGVVFSSLADLERKTRDQVGRFEGGSWEDMLMCVPGVEELSMRFEWRNTGEVIEGVMRGGRVGDVVSWVRGVLSGAAEEARKVGGGRRIA
jgi:hypothetical protein